MEKAQEETLVQGIQDIAGKISSARVEISHVDDDHIKEANLELDAVVKHTEESANKIMDSSEAIMALAGEIGGENGDKITGEVTKIFEACNFQDITGQRIKKVVDTLQDIENTVLSLLDAINSGDSNITLKKKEKIGNDERPDAELMRGPQLEEDKPSQEDIDKLFAGE